MFYFETSRLIWCIFLHPFHFCVAFSLNCDPGDKLSLVFYFCFFELGLGRAYALAFAERGASVVGKFYVN